MAEFKLKSTIELMRGERKYSLELDSSSPLGEVFDALCEMQSYVIKRIQDSQPKPEEKEAVKSE